jgi:predicted phage terminase large subunit-like protein
LFPELEDILALEEIKGMISPPIFAAQYQQNPIAPGGNRISWDKLQFYDSDVMQYARSDYTCIVQSWDTACLAELNSDYSACTTVGLHRTGKWHVINVVRGQLSYDRLRERALLLARQYKPDRIIIETAASGYALISDMRQQLCGGRFTHGQLHILGYRPKIGKEERTFTRQHKLEDGTFLFPESAPWLSDFRQELTAFPVGKNDDQVDSLIQAIDYLETGSGKALLKRDPRTFRPTSAHRRVRR